MGAGAVFHQMVQASMRIRFAAALLMPLLLTGCLDSRVPLFDATHGETPMRTGKYNKQEYLLGHWIDKEKGKLTLSNSVYEWRKESFQTDAEGQSKTTYDNVEHAFTVHGIGGGQFVAMKSCPSCETNKYVYDLIELLEGDILQSGVECDSVRKIRDVMLVFWSETVCTVENVGKLIDVMRSFSARSYPRYRYVRTGETEP